MTEFLLGFYFGGLFIIIALNVITRTTKAWFPLVEFGGIIGSYSIFTKWDMSWSCVGIVFWPIVVVFHLALWLCLEFKEARPKKDKLV